MVSGQWSVISGQWSVISGQWSILRQSDAQHSGVEHVEADFGMTCAQGTVRPFALKLAKHVLPLRDGQATPFHFGHKHSLRVIRVGRD